MTQERKEHIQYLLARYAEGNLSGEEEHQLWQLMQNEEDLPEWETIVEEYMSAEQPLADYNKDRWQPVAERILEIGKKDRGKVRRMPGWMKWVAAAVLIAGALTSVWLIVGRDANKGRPEVAQTHDVPAPSNSRAVITLANGSKVYLDSAGNGTIAQENNVNVVKNAEGGISYVTAAGAGGMSPAGGGGNERSELTGVDQNTLYNPRGSKVISLTLSDGTKVWLNSESSLRYPASFGPSALNREVEITGEAYFEVKHNSKQPFQVHLPNGSIVEDIGTAFNVNAYPDEDAIKTTLIEGAVRVATARGPLARDPRETEKVLKPGQQAILNQANPSILPIKVQTVNVDEVTAWKNGSFNLSSTDFSVLMRQVARWYDVDVEYKGPVPQNKFGGTLSRDLSLSTLLKALQQSGINAQLEGRKIVVR